MSPAKREVFTALVTMGIEIVSEALALLSECHHQGGGWGATFLVGVYFEMCAQRNWWSPFAYKCRAKHGQDPVQGWGGVVCLRIVCCHTYKQEVDSESRSSQLNSSAEVPAPTKFLVSLVRSIPEGQNLVNRVHKLVQTLQTDRHFNSWGFLIVCLFVCLWPPQLLCYLKQSYWRHLHASEGKTEEQLLQSWGPWRQPLSWEDALTCCFLAALVTVWFLGQLTSFTKWKVICVKKGLYFLFT